jgi:hypothetical protein
MNMDSNRCGQRSIPTGARGYPHNALVIDWIARCQARCAPIHREIESGFDVQRQYADHVVTHHRKDARHAHRVPAACRVRSRLTRLYWQTLEAYGAEAEERATTLPEIAATITAKMSDQHRRDIWLSVLAVRACDFAQRLPRADASRVARLLRVSLRAVERDPTLAMPLMPSPSSSPSSSPSPPISLSRVAANILVAMLHGAVGCAHAQRGRWRDAVGYLYRAISVLSTFAGETRSRQTVLTLAEAIVHAIDALFVGRRHLQLRRLMRATQSVPVWLAEHAAKDAIGTSPLTADRRDPDGTAAAAAAAASGDGDFGRKNRACNLWRRRLLAYSEAIACMDEWRARAMRCSATPKTPPPPSSVAARSPTASDRAALAIRRIERLRASAIRRIERLRASAIVDECDCTRNSPVLAAFSAQCATHRPLRPTTTKMQL